MNGQGPDSLPRRQTDPLWIQDHFLTSGHDENTPNATATFVKRKGRHYLVTCRHVLEIVCKRRTDGGERQLTMALQIDGIALNLSRVSEEGVVLSVRALEARMHSERADIALAPLDESYWNRLSERKNKEAVDLDSWREPDWSVVRHCLAVGYGNERKEAVRSGGPEKVAARMLETTAELASPVARRDTTRFVLSSTLPSSHGYGFSGMSGGAVYAIEESDAGMADDESLVPVGIVYEGFPGSTRQSGSNEEGSMGTIFNDRDILIRAMTLTPDTFDDWLHGCGLEQSRS